MTSQYCLSKQTTKPTITCSKLTIETLKQGVKYVKGNNKGTRTTPMALFYCLYS